MLRLRVPYSSVIRNDQPKVHTPSGTLSDINQGVILPPFNTDIRFSNLIRFQVSKSGLRDIQTLPEEFSWHIPKKEDTIEQSIIKKHILKPPNQGMCGSCWAIASITGLSDNFVVSKIVDKNPMLSYTWALSCYPQGRCEGGNPADLLTKTISGGVPTSNCVDYSWCLTDDNCIGQSRDVQTLDSKIPTCGCYVDKPHYVFKNDSVQLISIGNNVSEDSVSQIVKNHILTKGPVVTGFMVFSNFTQNKSAFTRVNGGVYLDRANYNDDNITFSDEENNSINFQGCHAVVIIGWGIARGIKVDTDRIADVPYWWCRNSWGVDWGERGFFKMAMYPYNKISQFDKNVIIQDVQGNTINAGGIIMIDVSKFPTLETLGLADYSGPDKVEDSSFYQKDPQFKVPTFPTDKRSNNFNRFTRSIKYASFGGLTILLLIVVVIILWKVYKKRTTPKYEDLWGV